MRLATLSTLCVLTLALSACDLGAHNPPLAPTPPPSTTPDSIRLVGASRPDGTIGLTATVLTSDLHYVANVSVSFATSTGSITPSVVLTNKNGEARTVLAPATRYTTVLASCSGLEVTTTVLSSLP